MRSSWPRSRWWWRRASRESTTRTARTRGCSATTDFGIVERIRSGEAIPLAVLHRGEGRDHRQIIEFGDSFEFNGPGCRGTVTVPAPRPRAPDATPSRAMTVAENFFASPLRCGTPLPVAPESPGDRPGRGRFSRTDIASHTSTSPPCRPYFFERRRWGGRQGGGFPTASSYFRDHLTFLHKAMQSGAIEDAAAGGGEPAEVKQRSSRAAGDPALRRAEGAPAGSEAICHSRSWRITPSPGCSSSGRLPTPHAGATRVRGLRGGPTAIFNSWIHERRPGKGCRSPQGGVTGPPRPRHGEVTCWNPPAPLREGRPRHRQINRVRRTRWLEALSVDERATMTKMAADGGGLHWIVAADSQTGGVRWVSERGDWTGPGRRRSARWDAVRPRGGVREGHRDRRLLHPSHGGPPQRPRERPPAGRTGGGAHPDRHRLRRVVHGGEEGGHGHVRRRLPGCGGPGAEGPPGCAVLQSSTAPSRSREYKAGQGYVELFFSKRMGAEVIDRGAGRAINAGPGVTAPRTRWSHLVARTGTCPGRSGPRAALPGLPYSVVAKRRWRGTVTAWERGSPYRPLPPVKVPVGA